MSGRIKIKSKDKDKRPKIDVFKVIENRFKNMNELRDLIDMDPRKGLVRIRDGAGFREVGRGGPPPRNRPGRSAVFRVTPPNPQKSKNRNGKRSANRKKNAYFSFKLLIINDINQYFNIHLYLIGFIIYNR